MDKIKVENWNSHEIRFVDHNGEWWAVATDIAKALSLKQTTRALSSLDKAGVTNCKVGVKTGTKRDGTDAYQKVDVNIINEKNIYKLVFKSRKKEAVEFQDWTFDTLKKLRRASGLEAFQVFRMLDKDHQRKMMDILHTSLPQPSKRDYIKANTIANKATSTLFGYPKMIGKDAMDGDMLQIREQILEDTVHLMSVKESFGLDLSVSQKVYDKYQAH